MEFNLEKHQVIHRGSGSQPFIPEKSFASNVDIGENRFHYLVGTSHHHQLTSQHKGGANCLQQYHTCEDIL